MKLTDECIDIIQASKPIVKALNKLRRANEIAADKLLKKDIEVFDDEDLDCIRNLTMDHEQEIWDELNEIVSPYGLTVQFQRVGGKYLLIEKPRATTEALKCDPQGNTKISASQKEVDTMIAALRLYQQNIRKMPDDIIEIAENGRQGFEACLNSAEIDLLINTKLNR